MIYHTNTPRLAHNNRNFLEDIFESISLYTIYCVLTHVSLMAYISASHWAGDTNDGLVNLPEIASRGLNELLTINQHALMASFDFYSKIIGCIFNKRSLDTQTYQKISYPMGYFLPWIINIYSWTKTIYFLTRSKSLSLKITAQWWNIKL